MYLARPGEVIMKLFGIDPDDPDFGLDPNIAKYLFILFLLLYFFILPILFWP